jgi:glycosyltransferase involved in cell wall biosynthesis
VQPEGLQRATVEAQAMARPVIVSDLAAGPEVVLTPPGVPESRITGLRCNARDDAALAAALDRLLADEALRDRMGAAGRERALTCFDAGRTTDALLAVLREAVARFANRPVPEEGRGR